MGGPRPISLEQLEILDAIDRRGSFARAAEELGRATSALSYGVQRLEEQLDVSLFRRQGRRSVLTPAGRLVLEDGRKLLAAADQLVSRAREVATGWEPRLCIGVESLFPLPELFSVLTVFLSDHPGIELDVTECVLNGGWEALERERVDVIIGVPGPVPRQLGYRSEPLPAIDLVPVIATCHPEAKTLTSAGALQQRLPGLRRVVTHDTSSAGIARSAGLEDRGAVLYVQNMDQKVAAIRSGSGIGHLPRHRVDSLLESGELLALPLASTGDHAACIAWKVSSRGRGLQALTGLLIDRFGT